MLPRLVSVIIPAYNGLPLIDEQLDALAAQDYAGDFEVVVSDNGSTDGLREHLSRHPLTDRLRMRWIDSSDRQGTPHARNVGIAAAHGDFLAFTDQDDRVHPGWLTALAVAAREFDAVGGAVETASINTASVASWRPMPAPDERFEESGYLPYAIGCTFGIWRPVIEKVGGFDETFTRGGEDTALSWTLQLNGFTLGHAPDALVAYRFRTTYRDTWRQLRGYGENSVKLYLAFREHGHPRHSARNLALSSIGVILLNPLVPRFIARIPRGMWVAQTGFLVGKIRAGIKHRVFYI
ncbi:glycosyltransferase family 2 protein [Rhodococcus maanshanensis]|uniref:glycosyltransferase n=1 Tax=Rhodococcus maanshanensis TaxID=183556 RepID=UPI0022B3DE46|nr:glycosyltransferase family 2 protein [Rhodococcus maanshanensis]MCZ4558130.1 glycosyltransferase family 2 protein [Rhodococcus maanshanensis]